MNGVSMGATVGGIAAGASIVHGTVQGTTSAYVGPYVEIGQEPGQTVGSVSLTSAGTSALNSNAQALSVGLASGSGAVATADSSPTVTAYVSGPAAIASSGTVTVAASTSKTATAKADGLTVGALVGVGIVDSTAETGGQTSAYVGTGATLEVGALLVQATAADTATATSAATAGGLIGDGDNDASASVTSGVSAYLGDNVFVDAAGNVRVEAKASPEVDATTTGVAAGGVAVGGSLSDVTIDSAVAAYIGAESVVQAGGSVTISAMTREDSPGGRGRYLLRLLRGISRRLCRGPGQPGQS
jgi:hypothetical protein